VKPDSKSGQVPPLLAQIAFQVELVPTEEKDGSMHARIHFGIRLKVDDAELRSEGKGRA